MSTVTLGEVAQLADQLPLSDQMKLLAHLCQQLRVPFPTTVTVEGNEPQARHIREAIADTFLQELDEIAERIEGQFDAVSDLRQIRQQRVSQL